MATIQEIIKKAYSKFEGEHRLPQHVRKAAKALMECRTSALGGHVQACPEGHYQKQWYNSCRNRACPQCNRLQIEQWLQKQKERLLNCGHHHLVFTIPHELNEIWLLNLKVMTNILFLAVRDTLFDFFLDKKQIGGKPGIIMTLQTWSDTLVLHPHIHCLATEGGLSEAGKWITRRKPGYLFKIELVMQRYRGKLLAYIDKAVDRGKLNLPATMSIQKWKNLKNKLGRKKWNVNIGQRYEYGKGVLMYLARYIRGGSISNKRIVSFRNGEVTFRYQKGKGKAESKKDTMTLPVDRFLRRYFLHVPEPHTKVVRYYGLYAPTAKEELSECRRQSGQAPVKETDGPDWQSYCERRGDEHPELCPICGRKLVRLADIPRPSPEEPPDRKRVRAAA